MTIPTITAAPPAPNRATMTDAEFAAAADLFTAWWVTQPAEYNAFAPALVAAAAAANYTASSTTSLAVGTGSKAFDIGTGKMFTVGQDVKATSTGAPTATMLGTVASYSAGILTLTVTVTGGSGTHADWSIGLAGPKGDTGATGANGADGSSSLYTQIASTATTSGSSITFASIPNTYQDLMLLFAGVSHNGAGSLTFRIELSDDGSNWTSVLSLNPVGSPFTAANTVYGSVSIPGYRKAAGRWDASLAALSADRTINSVNTDNGSAAWRIAAGIAHIRISIASDAFDAGSITLFGK